MLKINPLILAPQNSSMEVSGRSRRTPNQAAALIQKLQSKIVRVENRNHLASKNDEIRVKAMREAKRKSVCSLIRQSLEYEEGSEESLKLTKRAEEKAQCEHLFRECYIETLKEGLTTEELNTLEALREEINEISTLTKDEVIDALEQHGEAKMFENETLTYDALYEGLRQKPAMWPTVKPDLGALLKEGPKVLKSFFMDKGPLWVQQQKISS